MYLGLVGAGLLAKAVCQSTSLSTGLASSRASPLPLQFVGARRIEGCTWDLWERACSRKRSAQSTSLSTGLASSRACPRMLTLRRHITQPEIVHSRALLICFAFVARGLAPVGLRSGPRVCFQVDQALLLPHWRTGQCGDPIMDLGASADYPVADSQPLSERRLEQARSHKGMRTTRSQVGYKAASGALRF